jgi:transcriptional regulator with XRE-family HTH domain
MSNPVTPAPADRQLPSLNRRLAHSVRSLRSAAGFSQEAFAAKVGIHRTFMSSIERGKTNVSLETLERLAAGLGIHVWQLIRRAETGSGLYARVAEPKQDSGSSPSA